VIYYIYYDQYVFFLKTNYLDKIFVISIANYCEFKVTHLLLFTHDDSYKTPSNNSKRSIIYAVLFLLNFFFLRVTQVLLLSNFSFFIICNTEIWDVFLSSKTNQTNRFHRLFFFDVYAKSSRFMRHGLHFLRVMLLLAMPYFPVRWYLMQTICMIISWILYNLSLKLILFLFETQYGGPLVFNGCR